MPDETPFAVASSRTDSITIAHYGLGPIGLGIAALAVDRGYRPVAAIDIEPKKVGRDLGALLDRGTLGVTVTNDAAAALAAHPRVVLHSTQSRLAQVTPQLLAIIEAGASVISTCEELAFPWYHHAQDARRIDEAATARGVTVVGLGINPGFVMDLLPIVLTAPCREIRAVHVTRVVDAGLRRLPLQRKVGAGMTRVEFEDGVASGRIGHVGLKESVAMIADALGWRLDSIDERIEPVLDGGTVRGLHQVATGRRREHPGSTDALPVTLDLTMAIGASNPRDAVTLDGDPPITMTVAGGIHGDVATCALAVNALPRVLAAPPGLITVHSLPPIHG
ncbi:MAG: NAD(P)H-dependent amine dehydrogenase family protein [bacterium]